MPGLLPRRIFHNQTPGDSASAETLNGLQDNIDAGLDAAVSAVQYSVSPVVPSSTVYRDGNKDGFNYIQGFLDQSGGSASDFYSAWAARGTKDGAGTLNMFWGRIAHRGSGEAGLYIGDVTADPAGLGGNIWGFDCVLNDPKNVTMYGGRIMLNPTVARTSKVAYAMQIVNQNDAIQLDQGLRIEGNWDRPISVYSQFGGTGIIFDVDTTGNVRTGGSVSPKTNGVGELGVTGQWWSKARVLNMVINHASETNPGTGNIVMKNTDLAPGAQANGGAIYIEGGALKYRGSSGTITTVAPA